MNPWPKIMMIWPYQINFSLPYSQIADLTL